MVELQIKAGSKNEAIQAFEQRGPNRNPGVTFKGAWIGLHTDVAFVLVESAEEPLVSAAAKSWSEIGDFRISPVIDIEQF
jgi:hypothetical protein